MSHLAKKSRAFRRTLAAVALAAATALSVVACAAGPAPESTAPVSGEPHGTLRVATAFGVSSWDPARSPGGPELSLFIMVYDRLTRSAPSGDIVPGAAESWEFEDDGRTLVLTLREGLTFADGTPIDGDVIKQNLERSMTLPESVIAPLLRNIESVEADGNQVRIVQKSIDSGLLAILAERPGMIVNPATFDALTADDIPVASGQMSVVAQQPGTSYELERNDSYHGADEIHVEGVQITVTPDSTARLNALRTGAVDISRIDADQVTDAESGDLQLTSGPVLETMNLLLNASRVPAFADPDVRQAMTLALDRKAIVDGVLFGEAAASAQPYPAGHRVHVDSLDEEMVQDLDLARELLEKAGYADGFSFDATVNSPKSDRPAQAVQSQLAEIGITVNLHPTVGYTSLTDFTQGKVDAGIFPYYPRLEPNLQFRVNFTEGQAYNPGAITDPEISKLIAESVAELDPDKRTEIDREIVTLSVERPLNVIHIFTANQLTVARPNVGGVVTWMDGLFPHLEGITID